MKTPSPGRTGSRSWCSVSSEPSGSGRASSRRTALVPTSMAASTGCQCAEWAWSAVAGNVAATRKVAAPVLGRADLSPDSSRARDVTVRQLTCEHSAPVDLDDPQLFINRELSWLAFNERVLAEARDAGAAALRAAEVPRHRLLEPRRVLHGPRGGPQAAARSAAWPSRRPTACSPAEQLAAISERAHAMVGRAVPRLARGAAARARRAAGIARARRATSSTAEQKAARAGVLHVARCSRRSPRSRSTRATRSRTCATSRSTSRCCCGSEGRQRKRAEPRRDARWRWCRCRRCWPRWCRCRRPTGQRLPAARGADRRCTSASSSPATRSSRPPPSASRATGTSTSTRRSPRTCSRPSRRSCAGATAAPRCGSSSTPARRAELEQRAGRARCKLGAADVYRVDGPLQLDGPARRSPTSTRAPELRVEPLTPGDARARCATPSRCSR